MQLTKINGEFELLLPQHRALRPEWDIVNGGWEVKRIFEMIKWTVTQQLRLGRPALVFDVGAEEGDISALLAKYAGCDMVLVEPNNRVWPCIKAIWQANKLPQPLGVYPGFFSNDNYQDLADLNLNWDHLGFGGIIADHGFKELHDNYSHISRIKLDEYVKITGWVPDMITMDVEGSELEVIRGAEKTLIKHKPVIFMSVHPVEMFKHYGQYMKDMLKFIHSCGYTHRCIELDYHELHVVFEPK